MTSETTNTHPAWSASVDLTAKARVRNAAFELFATKGEAGTTIREVAQQAGVTHGLVVHHFQNKQGLRRAVQQHMVDLLRHALSAAPSRGTPDEVGRGRDANVDRMYQDNPAFLRYLRRMLIDPEHLDTELIDVLADFTISQVRELRAAGVATSDAPEHTQVLAILVRELAPRLLEPAVKQIWEHLTGDATSPAPELEVKIKPGTTDRPEPPQPDQTA